MGAASKTKPAEKAVTKSPRRVSRPRPNLAAGAYWEPETIEEFREALRRGNEHKGNLYRRLDAMQAENNRLKALLDCAADQLHRNKIGDEIPF
ncbi:MAG: hypothetical protein KF723_23025 [Rhizobiaceae bacterium]|nr:hypothetical protein [Rhizobiaceae bacterium]